MSSHTLVGTKDVLRKYWLFKCSTLWLRGLPIYCHIIYQLKIILLAYLAFENSGTEILFSKCELHINIITY